MAYTLYWGAGSPHSWRAMLALEVMGLEYNARLLEFSKNEHQSPEMIAMNPRGQLPVLRDNDISVYESIAILAYLDRKHPDMPLFGSTPQESAYIWQRVFEFENYLYQPIVKIIRPIFFDDIDDNIDVIEKAAKYVQAEFTTLETYLQTNHYLATKKICAADIVLFPGVQALQRAMTLKASAPPDLDIISIDKNYPAIANWITRIEATPGYERTYPPNWKN